MSFVAQLLCTFAQSKRTKLADCKDLAITLCFQSGRDLVDDPYHFVLHVENSSGQNELDADCLADPDRVGKRGVARPRTT
jgi:hypothetical protein